jgi:hypothetical protein
MRKGRGIVVMGVICFVVLAGLVLPARSEQTAARIVLPGGSVLHLTQEQFLELLNQPGLDYAEAGIPVPEELGGGYIVGSEEDIEAAIDAIVAADPLTVGTHTLTVTVAGEGTVTSGPKGISCPGTCSGSFKEGSKVSLKAKAAAGFVFTSWSGGGCSGTAPCKVAMAGDQAVTATFTAGVPAIKVTPESPKHFGNTKMGTTKSATFTIKNEGTGNLNIGHITLVGENTLPNHQYFVPSANDACSNQTINPKKSCKFKVEFKPTLGSPQPLRADVNIPSNAPNTPAVIQLFGAGT